MTPTDENSQYTDELFREYYRTKSIELRNELVERHLHIAERVAFRYLGKSIDYDDLYQIASFAVLLAIERFDPDGDTQFQTYATSTILGEIKRYYRDSTWAVKVPRKKKELSLQIPIAKERLQYALGRAPTIAELAEDLKVSDEDILEAIEINRSYYALSLELDNMANEYGEPMQFERYIEEEETGYEEAAMRDVLEKVMQELSPKEKDIIRKRFLQEMTQREVSEALGISQMTVSRIEKGIQRKFREEYNK